jgi:glyoxylase-like metal-dependent hydrolase (beta-lactamase superfamily II)
MRKLAIATVATSGILALTLAVSVYVGSHRRTLEADDHEGGAAYAQTAQPAAPVREISRIAGEIYRFRNNNHTSIFAVTPEGIIVTDPIDAQASAWWKAELKARFNKPVRYVIYSHDHRDHIAGGEVFADTAIAISHQRAKEAILGEKRPTLVPQITFTDRMDLELGGTLVELRYVGRNHSDNSIVMRFPKERVLYAVDFIPVESVAFRDFPDAYMPDWIDSLRQVEALDFDILAPGHGKMGRKEHVRMFREYLEDLHGQVLRLARDGKTADDAKRMVDLTRYQNWGSYKDFAPLNIEGMYRMVQANRRPN